MRTSVSGDIEGLSAVNRHELSPTPSAVDTLQLPPILSNSWDFKILRDQIRRIDGDEVGNVVVLSFRALQLCRIAKLQASLIKMQNDVMESGSGESHVDTNEDKQADELIQRYCG